MTPLPRTDPMIRIEPPIPPPHRKYCNFNQGRSRKYPFGNRGRKLVRMAGVSIRTLLAQIKNRPTINRGWFSDKSTTKKVIR